MSEVKHVTLKQLVEISSSLANIVSKSYGPRCQSSLLLTSTGKVMLTTDGIKLLNSLCIGHPVAKVIIQAIENHQVNYGDGVKTFLLYLKEFLNCLSSQSETGNSLQTVSRKITTFKEEILSECLKSLWSGNLIYLDSSCSKVQTCRHLSSVIKSTLSPHFLSSQTELFSKLILNSLTSDVEDLSSILDRVETFSDYFEYLHVKSKQSYSSSKIVPGILIRDFTCCSHNLTNNHIKFIILRNSIEGIVSHEPEETIHISKENNLTPFFTRQTITTNDFLSRLVPEGVELVFTNQKLPQYVISLCIKYKISVVGYLDDEEISFLEKLSSCLSMSSVNDEFSGYNIGETSVCQRVKYNSRYYVNLNFKNTPYLNSYLLCAPTEGLCFELSTLIFKTIKTLHMASNRNQNKNHSEFFVKMIQTPVTEMCQPDLDTRRLTTDDKEIKAGSDSFTIEEIVLCNNQDENVLCNNSQEGLSKECFTPTNKLGAIKRDEMLLIPGGGFFEFQLAKAINKISNNFKCVDLNSLCHITREMLLSVPRTLCTNTSAKIGSEPRHCVQVLHQILQSSKPLGLNSKGVVYNPEIPCEILESFYLKVTILYNVLQLVQQLLRLDMIIGVKQT